MPLSLLKTQILDESFAHIAARIKPSTLAALVTHFCLAENEMQWIKENNPELYLTGIRSTINDLRSLLQYENSRTGELKISREAWEVIFHTLDIFYTELCRWTPTPEEFLA